MDEKKKPTSNFAKNEQSSKANNKNILYVCLICKRKFEDEEKLRKHEAFSDLHRVNKRFLFYKEKIIGNANQNEK